MYQLKIKERAPKDMHKLAPSFRGRMAQLIRSLAKDPPAQLVVKAYG
ncbi:MAG: hypothetical protein QMD08_00015 [Actinomycetota bacterium]|nr:hypothetical protein [Actinomycetota bacterium]